MQNGLSVMCAPLIFPIYNGSHKDVVGEWADQTRATFCHYDWQMGSANHTHVRSIKKKIMLTTVTPCMS